MAEEFRQIQPNSGKFRYKNIIGGKNGKSDARVQSG
jgi:hypothetical protein